MEMKNRLPLAEAFAGVLQKRAPKVFWSCLSRIKSRGKARRSQYALSSDRHVVEHIEQPLPLRLKLRFLTNGRYHSSL